MWPFLPILIYFLALYESYLILNSAKAFFYGICGMLALLAAFLAQSVLVEYLAYLTALTAFGMVVWWPDPQRSRYKDILQTPIIRIMDIVDDFSTKMGGILSRFPNLGKPHLLELINSWIL